MIESEEIPKSEEPKEKNGIALAYGDIIELLAPSNEEINEQFFFIYYLGSEYIRTINIASKEHLELRISESGGFTDESITGIILASRSEVEGYARQNNLLPKTWVEIHFGGDLPVVITGQITSLEGDCIEITTYPDLVAIYIDFEYRGLPENTAIPIDKIIVREKPTSLGKVNDISELSADEPVELEDVDAPQIDEDDVPKGLEDVVPDTNVLDDLRDMYNTNSGIVFGEYLGQITQFVEKASNEKRFGIDVQLTSLMDELLSTIPNAHRTKYVVERVQTLVERFKELREMYSVFDSTGNIKHLRHRDPSTHKPLVDILKNASKKLQWLMPVVGMRKKIYDTEPIELEQDTVWIDQNADVIAEDDMRKSAYYQNRVNEGSINYQTLLTNSEQFTLPTLDPTTNDGVLAEIRVAKTIDTIVNNFEDYYSNVYNKVSDEFNIVKRKYVIQTYLSGASRTIRKTEGGTKQIMYSMPEKMSVKSLITYPAPVMQYSRLELDTANILERANLHQSLFFPFRILRQNTKILPYILQDLKTEIDYEKIEEETKQEFLSSISEYVLADNLQFDSSNEENYENFLRLIIPKTKVLIHLIRKYIKDKLSFVEIANILEPFGIYSDDISYKQYMQIRYFLKERINELKTTLQQKKQDYEKYRTQQTSRNIPEMNVVRIISQVADNNFFELFQKVYRISKTEVLDSSKHGQPSYTLSKIYEIDQGVLFSKILSHMLLSLVSPHKLLEDSSESEGKISNQCIKQVLTKKYTSIAQLQKDNHTSDVFYDKEFDHTPYALMSKYKEDQKKRMSGDFPDFLEESLIQKEGVDKELAKRLARTLIEGKKRVENGEYAVLVEIPELPKGQNEDTLTPKEREEIAREKQAKMKMTYYVRKNGNWVHDDSIDEEMFVDNNELFCAIKKGCLKTNPNAECESEEHASLQMIEKTRKKALKEFDRRYELTAEELEKNLQTSIQKQMKYLIRWNAYRTYQSQKTDHNARILAASLKNSEEAPLITSPHLNLLDLIMGSDDFIQKQLNIVKFYNQFCREPLANTEEEPHWKYCSTTGTKLLPGFLYELANEFVLGGDYNLKLQQICALQGELSDDGDSIVDRFGSGRVIAKIDFSDDEGFNAEGFRISTRSVLESSLGEQLKERLASSTSNKVSKAEIRVFNNEEIKEIYNIVISVADNIGVPLEIVEDNILHIVYELFKQLVPSKEKYVSDTKKIEAKTGKKAVPYEKLRSKRLILLSALGLFISIQTAVPTFQTRKTFPGCVRSFDGYPLTGVENNDGLKYLACVLYGMRTKIEPWSGLEGSGVDSLVVDMRAFLEKHMLAIPAIEAKYKFKREYIQNNPDPVIALDVSVERWLHFVPALVDTNILKNLQTVGSNFIDDMMSAIKQGHKDQYQHYLVLKSKVDAFSYGIVEAIQEIVGKKDLLLKTSGQTPFIQNACCNEPEKSKTPLQYFKGENENIERYIRTAGILSAFLEKVDSYKKPQMAYHPASTQMKLTTNITQEISRKTMYESLIYYCRLDKSEVVPQEFRVFFKARPAGYNPSWSLQEKIAFVEKELGRPFDSKDMQELMTIVARKNTLKRVQGFLNKENNTKYNPIEITRDLLDVFDNTEQTTPVLELLLTDKLRDVLDTYEPGKMVSPNADSAQEDMPNKIRVLNKLKNYLEPVNARMVDQIAAFMEKNANLSPQEQNRIRVFLVDIDKWNRDKWIHDIDYDVVQFFKNAIAEFIHILPNVLITNVKNHRIHTYWKLTQTDYLEMINTVDSYTRDLEKFRGDRVIKKLCMNVEKNLTDLWRFVENLPIYAPVQKGSKTFFALFDKQATYMLLKYCYYSVFYEYIRMSNDPDMLIEERVDRKLSAIEYATERSKSYGEDEIGTENMEDELYETEIELGNQSDLQKRVGDILKAFVFINIANKKFVDFSYTDIDNKVRGYRWKEKKRIVEKLGAMSIEERRVENMKKTYKLDNWYVGQEKGIYQYDAETQERERKENIEQGFVDVDAELATEWALGTAPDTIQTNEELVATYTEAADEYDLPNMARGVRDGVYYSEDEEDDFPDD